MIRQILFWCISRKMRQDTGTDFHEGENADALVYELQDMEKAIAGDRKRMHLDYTKDVMDLMTEFRGTWGMKYPEEEKKTDS